MRDIQQRAFLIGRQSHLCELHALIAKGKALRRDEPESEALRGDLDLDRRQHFLLRRRCQAESFKQHSGSPGAKSADLLSEIGAGSWGDAPVIGAAASNVAI